MSTTEQLTVFSDLRLAELARRGRPPLHAHEPACIVPRPWPANDLTLCGRSAYRTRHIVSTDAVAAHVEGWGLTVCPECAAAYDQGERS